MNTRAYLRVVGSLNAGVVGLLVYSTIIVDRPYWWLVFAWVVAIVGIAVTGEQARRIRQNLEMRERIERIAAYRFTIEYLASGGSAGIDLELEELIHEEYDRLSGWERNASKWPKPWPWHNLDRKEEF
jgi:xanthosine utilization system XapX-like protein